MSNYLSSYLTNKIKETQHIDELKEILENKILELSDRNTVFYKNIRYKLEVEVEIRHKDCSVTLRTDCFVLRHSLDEKQVFDVDEKTFSLAKTIKEILTSIDVIRRIIENCRTKRELIELSKRVPVLKSFAKDFDLDESKTKDEKLREFVEKYKTVINYLGEKAVG